MALVDIQIEEHEIESMSGDRFCLTSSLNLAEQCLKQYEDQNLLIKGEVNDDVWVFEHHLNKGYYTYFYFNFLDSMVDYKISYLKVIVKCWIADLLTKYYPPTVQGWLKILEGSLVQSEGFKKKKVDVLIRWIKEKEAADGTKVRIINSILNFLDYCDLETSDIFVPTLLEFRQGLKLERQVRQLPPSSEVLKFSYFLDKFFLEIGLYLLDDHNKKENELRILYYPLLIWWRLTNIIPLRATEFCIMSRKCLSIEGEDYYIKLPRIKDEFNNNRVQVIDRFKISTDMYELINNYVLISECYGKTDTLISYRSIAKNSGVNRSFLRKNNSNNFSLGILNSLIGKFYREIISEKYNTYISEEYHLTTNDTRHLAFTSLMMQGISPVEIARLGGHRTIAAQYHYQFHLEYWVDSEVSKLMKIGHGKMDIESNVIPKEVLLRAYLPVKKNKVMKKLKIGFCTDEFQRCQTEECLACDNWGVTPEEVIEKKDIIKEKILKSKKKIHELGAFIANIHRMVLNDELAKSNINTFVELHTTVNSANDEIEVLTKLLSIPIIEG